MTQCDQVLNHIIIHGTITSKEAFEKYGITRLSGRIFDLLERGYDIKTDARTGKTRLGKRSRYGAYRINDERSDDTTKTA